MPSPQWSVSGGNEEDGERESLERTVKSERLRLKMAEMEAKKEQIKALEEINKHERELNLLNANKNELSTELALIDSSGNQIRDKRNVRNLGHLGRSKNDIEKMIEDEKTLHGKLDAELRQSERKVKDVNKQTGGEDDRRTNEQKKEREVKRAENSLEQANRTFCRLLEENSRLRGEIDALRADRGKYDELGRRVECELGKLRRQVAGHVDATKQAYDQRDEQQQRARATRERADRDAAGHEIEMRELVRQIDGDRDLKTFMETKGRPLREDRELLEWREKKAELEADRQRTRQERTVRQYERAIERIGRLTDEHEESRFVENFRQTEQDVLALLNYVNEQSEDVKALAEQCQALEDDIEALKRTQESGNSRDERQLEQLESRRSLAAAEKKLVLDDLQLVQTAIAAMQKAVESASVSAKCDRAAVADSFDESGDVTQRNLLQHAGLLESRASQLLIQQAYFTTIKESRQNVRPMLIGDAPLPPPSRSLAVAPIRGPAEDSDGADDSEIPLSRKELTLLATQSLEKRMKKAEGKSRQRMLIEA